jgi:hypothetical protein
MSWKTADEILIQTGTSDPETAYHVTIYEGADADGQPQVKEEMDVKYLEAGGMMLQAAEQVRFTPHHGLFYHATPPEDIRIRSEYVHRNMES